MSKVLKIHLSDEVPTHSIPHRGVSWSCPEGMLKVSYFSVLFSFIHWHSCKGKQVNTVHSMLLLFASLKGVIGLGELNTFKTKGVKNRFC